MDRKEEVHLLRRQQRPTAYRKPNMRDAYAAISVAQTGLTHARGAPHNMSSGTPWPVSARFDDRTNRASFRFPAPRKAVRFRQCEPEKASSTTGGACRRIDNASRARNRYLHFASTTGPIVELVSAFGAEIPTQSGKIGNQAGRRQRCRSLDASAKNKSPQWGHRFARFFPVPT